MHDDVLHFDSGTTNALTISLDTGSSSVGEVKETIEVHPNPVASALTVKFRMGVRRRSSDGQHLGPNSFEQAPCTWKSCH